MSEPTTTIPVKLDLMQSPPSPPKYMAGQTLSVEQVQKLFDLLKTGYPPFVAFPSVEENEAPKVPENVTFLHIQADTMAGGYINLGYN